MGYDYHGGNVVRCILERWARGWFSYQWYLIWNLEIFFHQPSHWTRRKVKVHLAWDNDVVVQHERKVWNFKCMFLKNIEVIDFHDLSSSLYFSTQSNLKMVDFMNVKYWHCTIIFPTNYRIFKDKVIPSDNVFPGSCKEAK